MKRAWWLLLLLAGCGTPGTDIKPDSGDFAFVEIHLQG